MIVVWKDAGVALNTAHVAGIIDYAGDARSLVLAGMHAGQSIALHASRRDRDQTLAMVRERSLLVEAPLFDADEPGARITLVMHHVVLIAQVEGADPPRSRVSLSNGTHFELACTWAQLSGWLREAKEASVERAREAVLEGLPAAGRVQ